MPLISVQKYRMQYKWTREEINELLGKTLGHQNDYIAEHEGYLRVHLKKHDSLKSFDRKAQEWEKVEVEARKVTGWLQVLKSKAEGS